MAQILYNIPKKLMERDMLSIDFVDWDRFVKSSIEHKVELYGWIKREDTKTDFVVLAYIMEDDGTWTTSYITSSSEMSEVIHERLGCEQCAHNKCIRVEKEFNIDNMVRLNGDGI